MDCDGSYTGSYVNDGSYGLFYLKTVKNPLKSMNLCPYMVKICQNCQKTCHVLWHDGSYGGPGVSVFSIHSFVPERPFLHYYCKIETTVNFHHEHSIVPTNCPWVSEDAMIFAFISQSFQSSKLWNSCIQHFIIIFPEYITNVRVRVPASLDFFQDIFLQLHKTCISWSLMRWSSLHLFNLHNAG